MKSQTSVEFLIILSTVFIILMTYLAATGAFSNIVSRPDRSEYWELARIGVGTIAIGNASTIVVINNNPYKIHVVNGTLTYATESIEFINESLEIREYSQQQVDFDAECEPGEPLRVSFDWTFVNNLTGVEETFTPDRAMVVQCN